MWEFIHLKSASKGKGDVKPAAPDFKNSWNKLSRLDKIVLYGVAMWVIVLILLFTVVASESDSIDLEYYDNVTNTETERLA